MKHFWPKSTVSVQNTCRHKRRLGSGRDAQVFPLHQQSGEKVVRGCITSGFKKASSDPSQPRTHALDTGAENRNSGCPRWMSTTSTS